VLPLFFWLAASSQSPVLKVLAYIKPAKCGTKIQFSIALVVLGERDEATTGWYFESTINCSNFWKSLITLPSIDYHSRHRFLSTSFHLATKTPAFPWPCARLGHVYFRRLWLEYNFQMNCSFDCFTTSSIIIWKICFTLVISLASVDANDQSEMDVWLKMVRWRLRHHGSSQKAYLEATVHVFEQTQLQGHTSRILPAIFVRRKIFSIRQQR
jgi:hypothetical protein